MAGDTQATSGFGVDVYVSDGAAPEAFILLDELVDFTVPDFQLGTANATNHRSPGGFMEDVATLKSIGNATAKFNIVPASDSYQRLFQLFDLKRPGKFVFVYPDGSGRALEFHAHVTRIAHATPQEDVFQGNVELKGTGQYLRLESWSPT